MKFEEIFNNAGLYKSKDFAKGFAFKISKDGTLTGILYKNVSDLFPHEYTFPVSRNCFSNDYTTVYTIKQLFE